MVENCHLDFKTGTMSCFDLIRIAVISVAAAQSCVSILKYNKIKDQFLLRDVSSCSTFCWHQCHCVKQRCVANQFVIAVKAC